MRGQLPTNPTCELNTLAGPNTVDQIQTALDLFVEDHGGIPDEVHLDLGHAAREIAGNIVQRGSGGWPLRIRMAIRSFPNLVQISFTDNGRPVDGEPARVVSGSRVHYHRNRHGNHWTVLQPCPA